MNKKRFFSLLVSGKLGLSLIAGLKPPSASALTIAQCANQPFNLVLQSSPGVEYAGDTYGGYDSTSVINVFIPGTGCNYVTPTKIDLVLTGIKPKDEIYVGISTTKDDPNLLAQTQNKVRLGSDLQLLAWFSVNNIGDSISLPGLGSGFSADIQNTGMCLELPINLPSDLFSIIGEEFYIQTISFPNGQYTWNNARASDLVKIQVATKSCSPYDSVY